jgi:hypothetical protein
MQPRVDARGAHRERNIAAAEWMREYDAAAQCCDDTVTLIDRQSSEQLQHSGHHRRRVCCAEPNNLPRHTVANYSLHHRR